MNGLSQNLHPLCVGLIAAMMVCPLGLVRGDDAPQSQLPETVSFNEHIRPIFTNHCVACHGGVMQASGVSFVYRDKALAEGDSGAAAIVPGDVEASYLVERIVDTDPDYRMPPGDHGPPLSAREIALMKQWIAEGANWQEHWSLVPPRIHDPPENDTPNWGNNSIDPFVLARIEDAGFSPSPAAPKNEWLRRVTFDLTGLPPTAQEREDFLNDPSPDAYETVVDRLLDSPRYGERWAAMWLDLARYSDTMGYEKDPHRNIWPYRDWLIRALNEDLPYDQFIIKQLAGDLLLDATMGDRVATAFHRNTQTNTEGGTDDEEFRTAAVVDRVNTTWQVFGGLTFGCTQCHSHPYDPIENDEFYKFVAIFNSTRDCDRDEETPALAVPNDHNEWQRANQLDRRISQLKRDLHARVAPIASDNSLWSNLALQRANSTGQTKLIIRQDTESGASEFVESGTVTAGSVFTLEAALPESLEQFTALRIDSLPVDVAEALRIPETGFAVTRLRAWIDPPGDEPAREVQFQLAMCDEPEPLLSPAASLADNNDGWGVAPRIDRPRWAVFVPNEPIDVPAGSHLKVELKHNRNGSGGIAQVVSRGRLSASSDRQWTDLVSDDQIEQLRGELAKARSDRRAIASTTIPTTAELDDEYRRRTFVFERGNWLAKADEVQPGVPAVFPPIKDDELVDRLDVARWFASAEHPLTARVLVNRLWQQLFGIGIVETVGDFGSSGVSPSNPELLDDLAARFQTEMGWSTKRLLREMVLSATYRQQSRAGATLAKFDPQNRLLARGPRLRLTAEMVRDQALLLSGKLSDKMYGPSVMPPQPDNVWASVYSGAKWATAEGEDRYRRALYTYWKRTSPYPAMTMFDAPTREVCSVRRIATNTPLQPLVTMNDPAFVECAQGFAERMAGEGRTAVGEQIAWALEQATGDTAREAAISVLESLHQDATGQFDPNNEEMTSLGAGAEAYARTIVASAILNLDDAVTR